MNIAFVIWGVHCAENLGKSRNLNQELAFQNNFYPCKSKALTGKEGHAYFGVNNSGFTRLNHIKLSLVENKERQGAVNVTSLGFSRVFWMVRHILGVKLRGQSPTTAWGAPQETADTLFQQNERTSGVFLWPLLNLKFNKSLLRVELSKDSGWMIASSQREDGQTAD